MGTAVLDRGSKLVMIRIQASAHESGDNRAHGFEAGSWGFSPFVRLILFQLVNQSCYPSSPSYRPLLLGLNYGHSIAQHRE